MFSRWSVLLLASTMFASADAPVAPYHPRILINRDLNLNELRKWARGPYRGDFNDLKRILDGNFGWAFGNASENTMLTMVYGFAYMYQMTSDPRYADKVIDDYLVGANWSSGGANSDEIAFGLEAAAVTFDWTYDRVVARGLKDRIVQRLKERYDLLANDANVFRDSIREADFHNYVVEFESAWLMTGLALSGEHPSAPAMIDRGWGMMAKGYTFEPTSFGDRFTYQLKASIDFVDGAMNWEGPGYWRSAVPDALRGIEAYDTATNRKSDVWHTLFAKTVNAAYYKMYTLRPDLTTPGLGDSTAGERISWKDNFALAILDGRFKDGRIAQLIETGKGAWYGGYGTGLVMKLLFCDPAVRPAPWTGLPESRRFGREIVLRSGWKPGDVFATFSAGYSGVYHNHLDDNSFTIFRYADLATDGGYSLNEPYYQSYFKRTVAHNAITVTDPAECWRDNSGQCSLSNDGGQRWTMRRFSPPFTKDQFGINRLWSATVLADPVYREQFATAETTFDPAPDSDYILSDATKAYTNQWSGQGSNTGRRVSQAVREVVFLRNGTMVVLDRVASTKPQFRKAWLLHSVHAPQPRVDGKWASPGPGVTDWTSPEMRIDNAGGRLFVRTLLPERTKLQVIGGPGYEGWVNGRNYWAANVPEGAGKWRFEVSPAAPAAADLFLHVLIATSAREAEPAASARADSAELTGAALAGGVVLFSKSGQRLQSASYTFAGTGAHVVAGMAPGSYDIYRGGAVAVRALAASAAGVLRFRVDGGGNFQIVRSGSPRPQ